MNKKEILIDQKWYISSGDLFFKYILSKETEPKSIEPPLDVFTTPYTDIKNDNEKENNI